MPRGNAALYDMVPHSAREAFDRLAGERKVRLDTLTVLSRRPDRIEMLYDERGRAYLRCAIVTWYPDGEMSMSPRNESGPELRRIAAALPEEFAIDFRTSRRLRPRITYRGAWHTTVQAMSFRADGSIRFGRYSESMTRIELDREVSRIEGFEPMPSRIHPEVPAVAAPDTDGWDAFTRPMPTGRAFTRRAEPVTFTFSGMPLDSTVNPVAASYDAWRASAGLPPLPPQPTLADEA